MKTILILGSTGLLGSAIYRYLRQNPDYLVFGASRSDPKFKIDATDPASAINIFNQIQPDIVINCIGIIKQKDAIDDHMWVVNGRFPHWLAKLCNISGARLIHISTDCVFDGTKGNYVENDPPDSQDIYGNSKAAGEINYGRAITLRTSLIGHENGTAFSLLNWFMSQQGSVRGFKNAIFSGLPAVEIAKIIDIYVIPNDDLQGLYHLSGHPIDKFDLLSIIAKVYGKEIKIIPEYNFNIDRSLSSKRFQEATGYFPKPWIELIRDMHAFQ